MLPTDDVLIAYQYNERDMERMIQDLEESIKVLFKVGRLACCEFLFWSCSGGCERSRKRHLSRLTLLPTDRVEALLDPG